MRIDEYLFERGFFDSRNKAKESLLRGEIFLNGTPVIKPSQKAEENANYEIRLSGGKSFVSVGGYKLDKALRDFGLNVSGIVAADVGASTGGFTDCLLQNGAKTVYAVDLNDGLLHASLKNDERVVPVIKNARTLIPNDFPVQIELIVADLSFISATQVMKVFCALLKTGGQVVLLIKPQFEVGEKRRFKNGIVRDGNLHKRICRSVYDCAVSCGFIPLKITEAPLREDKNREFLMLLKKGADDTESFERLYKF